MSMNYLSQAFKELDLLEEGVELQVNKGGVSELESFLKEDDLVADVETIIDPEAETEEELQETYVGKVIVSCEVCNTLIYKNPEDLVIDEELSLVNVGELCPYCFNTDGYKVVGKVAPFEEVSVEAPEGVEVAVDGEPIESAEPVVDEPVVTETDEEQTTVIEEGLFSKKFPNLEDTYRIEIDFEVVDTKTGKIKDVVKDAVAKFAQSDAEDLSIEGQGDDTFSISIGKDNNTFEVQIDYYKDGVSHANQSKIKSLKDLDQVLKFVDKSVAESLEEEVKIPEADLILDSEELLLNDVDAGRIVVDKDVFDGFVENSIIKIKFLDNNDESPIEYRMVAETPEGIEMVYVGEPIKEEPEVLNEGMSDIMSTEEFLDWHDHKVNPKEESGKLDQIYHIFELNGCSDDDDVDYCYDQCDDKQKREIMDIIMTESFKKDRKPVEEEIGEVLNEDVDLLAKVDAFLDTLEKDEPVTEEVEDQPESEDGALKEGVDLLAKVDEFLASLEKDEPVKEELEDSDEKLEESFDNVNITTDNEVLKVESKDKDDETQASGMENVEITTDDSVIKIKSTPRVDKEVVVPVTEEEITSVIDEEETPEEITEEPVAEEEVVEDSVSEEPAVEEPVEEGEEDLNVDLPIDEFDEESFNDLAESYLKKVYDNVKSFKLIEGAVTEDDNLLLEGIIEFESGKSAKTKFTFEALDCQDNKVRFIGLNENLARKRKAFTICGSVNDSKLVCESLKYNYNVKQNGSSKRVYGTVSR